MKSRLVRRLHVTHEKRNLRKHYTALRFNAGGTADNDDDIRPGIQVCIPGRIFIMGFSLLSEMEFFAVPKNGISLNI